MCYRLRYSHFCTGTQNGRSTQRSTWVFISTGIRELFSQMRRRRIPHSVAIHYIVYARGDRRRDHRRNRSERSSLRQLRRRSPCVNGLLVTFEFRTTIHACKITIPIKAIIIHFAANCSRCEVVIPQLIVAVSRLLIPRHDRSARVTVFTFHVQHKSVQTTSDEIVRPHSRIARTWRIDCWRVCLSRWVRWACSVYSIK